MFTSNWPAILHPVQGEVVAEDWSFEEVAATVADYFAMLELELRGEPYNKKDHNRRLQSILHGRSAGAIEFKHANISAVLIELGFPYMDRYKPRANYQELLKDEVSTRLERDARLNSAAEELVEAPQKRRRLYDRLSTFLYQHPSAREKPAMSDANRLLWFVEASTISRSKLETLRLVARERHSF